MSGIFHGHLMKPVLSTSISSSSSSSPPPSPRPPAQIALGDSTEALSAYQQLPPWQKVVNLRDRAVLLAARLTVLIDAFTQLRDRYGYPAQEERETTCARLQNLRGRAISAAVELTSEIRRLDPRPNDIDIEMLVLQKAEMLRHRELQHSISQADFARWRKTLSLVRARSQQSVSASGGTSPEPVEFSWLGLIQSPPQGQDIAARVEELKQARVELSKEEYKLIFSNKRFDIVAQLVAKRIIGLRTAIKEDGEMLSLLACGIKHDLSDDFLKTLIEAKADLSVVVGCGEEAKTIVGVAIERGWETKLVELLINARAAIPRLIDGIPPLAFVYRKRRHDLFQLLLTRGVATNVVIDGKTLLGKILSEDEELSKIIVFGKVYERNPDGTRREAFDLISKFDLNATGGGGQTALHYYCMSDCFHPSIFHQLLSCGGKGDARNNEGKTVLELFFVRRGPAF